jgi:predicted pyridoxine 5'-phosphate oxidase superfamily flavin-nucleotide-binding protein
MQERHGSRARYARMQAQGKAGDALGAREVALLARADSFFLATVSETGWPYVQHRGGPPGFAKVVSPTRIAFADFRGNRQYVSVGNVAHEARAAIIVVDYAAGRRLKLLGRLRFTEAAEADVALLRKVAPPPQYPARVERVAQFDVAAFDWNCPQHLPQRLSPAQVAAVVQPLRERIDALERRLKDAGIAALE